MHGVSEYEPKEDTFELVKKRKQNRFDESKQRDDIAQNENENLIETKRREINSYPADPLENRYNHSKAKKEGHPRKRKISIGFENSLQTHSREMISKRA